MTRSNKPDLNLVFFYPSVTLSPNLEHVAFTAYSAVARQLPSMLRQWYLSLNRQNSAMVNK